MSLIFRAFPLLAAILLVPDSAAAAPASDPFRFFEGRTETRGTIRTVLKKPFPTHSIGHGRIEKDGSMVLVQTVQEAGRPVKERRWRIRRVSPTRFTGTMTEAIGPVTVEQVGQSYRFRFKMKGNMSAEQVITPQPGGASATSRLTVRKLGVKVASGESVIRKVPAAR